MRNTRCIKEIVQMNLVKFTVQCAFLLRKSKWLFNLLYWIDWVFIRIWELRVQNIYAMRHTYTLDVLYYFNSLTYVLYIDLSKTQNKLSLQNKLIFIHDRNSVGIFNTINTHFSSLLRNFCVIRCDQHSSISFESYEN